MKITVFKKQVTPKNGNKPFNKYITKISNKNAEEFYCDVRFNDGVTIPNTFPCIITLDKPLCNMTHKTNTYTDNEGNEREIVRHTIWIGGVTNIEKYIDHSLDDFE